MAHESVAHLVYMSKQYPLVEYYTHTHVIGTMYSKDHVMEREVSIFYADVITSEPFSFLLVFICYLPFNVQLVKW